MANIILPAPAKEGGMPIYEAFSKRRSRRDFIPDADIDMQDLSNLLWVSFGINRTKGRTAPSSHNSQETEIYVVLKEGIYIYRPQENLLEQVLEGDFRAMTGTQDFPATAPVNLIFVADPTKLKGKSPQEAIETIYADTGFISQNAYLWCAAEGFGCVARAMIDKKALHEKLQLPQTSVITLINTIGPVEKRPE